MSIDIYTKIDLHIHSVASKIKDGNKVKEGTVNNLDVLLKKLDSNEVNLFSFTDHNTFDYDLYEKAKEKIKAKDSPYKNIKNILPGVEFDIDFEGNKKRTHATCIFNDDNPDNLKKIDSIIDTTINKRKKKTIKFTENEINLMLKDINIDFIFIVHQKCDIQKVENDKSNNFSELDDETKYKLIGYDYFTLYESNQHTFRFRFEDFKKRNNMIGNFITGTDCHKWEEYPNKKNEFDFTYVKCDATFEGLKIAVTGNGERRIFNRLPTPKSNVVEKFEIYKDGDYEEIKLSSGVNAIIGGNTAGKSLLISKAFNKLDPKKKPEQFLKKWNLDFEEIKIEKEKINYINQGEIRKLFENDGKDLFSKFDHQFKKIDYNDYINRLKKYKNKLFEIIERNTMIKKLELSMSCIINIPNYEDKTYYPQVTPLPKKNSNKTLKIVKKFDKVDIHLKSLIEELEKQSKSKNTINEIAQMISRLSELRIEYDKENMIVETSNKAINAFVSGKNDYQNYIEENALTITEKELLAYDNTTSKYLDDLEQMINLKLNKPDNLEELIEEFTINEVSNEFGELKFVTSPKKSIYTKKDIIKILKEPLKKDYRDKNLNEFNVDIICNGLKNNNKDAINELNYAQKYDIIFHENLNTNFFVNTFKIILKDEEIKTTKSPGNNAINYYKTLAETLDNKIIVIDQPEDDVAPGKIKSELIKSISKMAIKNQVIIVTHNPQLVVNLDVDNVVCLEIKNDEYTISKGPLYEKGEANILELVANKLDGGKNTLKERWRRYE